MFCQKCGNQLNEGAAFCPMCGTKVDAATGIRVQDANENNVKPIRTKKSKKILIFLAAVIVVIVASSLIRNAIRTKDPITAERFIEVMESRGHKVYDATADYSDDDDVFHCYVAVAEGYKIYFFEMYSDTMAKKRYDRAYKYYKRQARNFDSEDVYVHKETGRNYSILSAIMHDASNDDYNCFARVGNVFISSGGSYLSNTEEGNLYNDMNALGLGYWATKHARQVWYTVLFQLLS